MAEPQRQQQTQAPPQPKRVALDLTEEGLAKPPGTMATIRALFQAPGVVSRIEAVIPTHMKPERLLKVIVSSIAKNPDLLECTQQSLLQCAVAMSELGLEPDAVRGLIYLVPFKEKQENGRFIKKCQVIIGYRGFIELARRSGMLRQVEARVVREKDKLDVRFGIDPKFEHVPFLDGDAGNVRLVYCIARFKDGGEHVEMMTTLEVERIRARSKQKDGKPWKEDWDEMAKKTVMRRAAKWLPLSPELARAIEIDDEQFIDGSAALSLPPQQRPALVSDNRLEASADVLDAVFASTPESNFDPETGVVDEPASEPPVSTDQELSDDEKALAASVDALLAAIKETPNSTEHRKLVPRIQGLPEPERSRVQEAYEARKKELAS